MEPIAPWRDNQAMNRLGLRSRICALSSAGLVAAPGCLFEDPCDGGPSCDDGVELEVRHLERVNGHTVFVVVDGVEG